MRYKCLWWFSWRPFLAAAYLCVLVPCLAALGCGVGDLTREALKPPKVNLKAVGLQAPTNQGWPMTCVLAVENPNSVTIKVLGYDYEVFVEGKSVAQGASNRSVTLPAQGETLVEVPVLLKLRTLPGLVPRLVMEEKLAYELAGGLRLPQTLGLRVPFRFRGELTAEQGLKRLSPLLDKHF